MLQRLILVATGLTFCVIGLNTGLGGMTTLGWQFPTDVLTVTDAVPFARHDSNARFFGGFFSAGGIVLVLAGLLPALLRVTAIAVLAMVAVAGLFRLFQPDFSVLADLRLMPSLAAEVILGPLLALWLIRSART